MPFARALARCLIVLALSPFTAPFAVCELNVLVAHPAAPLSQGREVDGWFVDGAATLDLPLVPLAAEIKAAALVTASVVDIVDDPPQAPIAPAGRQSVGAIRSPRSLVLRL